MYGKHRFLTTAVLGLFVLGACSTGQPAASVSSSVDVSPTTDAPVEEPQGDPTAVPSAAQPVAPDKTVVVKVTDPDGYRLQLTMQLSKWVRGNDPAAAEAAWRGVGGQGDAPLLADADSYVAGDSAAVLYGNATVTNLSTGFEASGFGGGNVQIALSPVYEKDGETRNYTYVMDQFGPLVSAAEFSSGIQFKAFPGPATSPGLLNPKLTSDRWGPVAFAIGFSSVMTPKSPDGAALDNVRFCAGIGVTCKDGLWAGYTYEGDTKPFSVARSWKS